MSPSLRYCFLIGAVYWLSSPGLAMSEGSVFFRETILPIFEKRCFECHSHASGKMKGGLTLDSRSGWVHGGERGAAVVPGKVETSLLIRAVRHVDSKLKMPKEKLPDSEIAALERWVADGAPDPRAVPQVAPGQTEWWSLKPLDAMHPPHDRSRPIVHPIDAFIDQKLLERHRKRSSSARPSELVRRVFFNLHGLPPSPQEVDAFSEDSSSDSWSRLVDRLLASPRYGERWARHWLDTIHFADTHGFEHDVLRGHAWRYRDYVVSSLNRDTAWPRFVREQLAADRFFPEQPGLTAALGFLGAGPYDQSAAGTAPKQFEYLDRDDLVSQTMSTFASTTIHCARCHAHKFDPISQEDYFAVQAVFAGVAKGDISFDPDAGIAKQRQGWRSLIAAADEKNPEGLLSESADGMVKEWEAMRRRLPAWRTLVPEVFVSSDGSSWELQPDGSLLARGKRPDKETLSVTVTPGDSAIRAIRLEVFRDESLPAKGPGRNENGNFHLSEFEVQWFAPRSTKPEMVKVGRATADFEQSGWRVGAAIDGDLKTAWGIYPAVGESHQAVFELDLPRLPPPGTRWVFQLKQQHGGGHLIGRLRLSAIDSPPGAAIALSALAEAALKKPRDHRSPADSIALASAVLRAKAEDELGKLPPLFKVYAAGAVVENERGTISIKNPKTIRLLKRGDIERPGEEIGPGALSMVTSLPSRQDVATGGGEASRRAWLADWLVHPDNPLSWRSIVNRVWQYHFGRGLCDTPGDFGRMGGNPSHPELLDWLAVWFRDEARGSLKELHRLILTSETYRQTSLSEPDPSDPDNRFLSRMHRSRLDADSYRDAVLAVSGRLDFQAGGQGVAHFKSSPGPQVTPYLDYAVFDWNSPGASRRSIYRLVWRAIPDPFMDALDFPDLGMLAPSRGFSASAPQALSLMNNEFVLAHAIHLAKRAEAESVSMADAVRLAARWVWLRDPDRGELEELLGLAERHGLAAVGRVLLNSNEFLFVD